MNKSDYSQLLRDPQWQKRRLHILEQHGFKCDECGDDKSELQVHHCWYDKDCNPWDYDDECFKVFCDEHHQKWHENKLRIEHCMNKFNSSEMYDVATLLEQLSPFDLERFMMLVLLGDSKTIDLLGIAASISNSLSESFQKGYEQGKNKK